MWLTAADSLISVTIMPTIGRELGGFAYLAWATAGFFLGSILAGASAGRLSERLGLRTATAMAGIVYAAGCAMSALAPNIELFLLGRFIQGVGGGWQAGFAYVAIGAFFPDRHLGRVFAVASGVWGIATLVGPLLGGVFAAEHAWRWLFWIFTAQALVFSLCATWLIPLGKRPHSSGIPLLQMAILALAIIAISVANLVPAGPAAALSLTGIGLIVLMTRIDARAPARILPHGAGDPATTVGAGYGAIFALSAAATGWSVYGPAILQTIRGFTPLVSGYIVASEAVGWTITAILVAHAGPVWADRFVRLGAVSIVIGLAILGVWLKDGPILLVIFAATLMGGGFGLCWAFMSRHIMGALSDDDRAIGSSAVIATQQAGNAVGAAIAGVAANLAGIAAGLSVSAAGRASSFVFIAAMPIGLLGLLAAWNLVRPGRTLPVISDNIP